MLLAAVLVAGLPYVAPYFGFCSGGLVTQTCTVPYSWHCCKSGRYLSATCCRNSCSRPISSGRSSTTACVRMFHSMCCSTKSLGSESCCGYADYSRTSMSSIRGDYIDEFNTCSGGLVAQTCNFWYSSHCCKSGTYLSATCCRNLCSRSSRPGFSRTTTCSGITNSMCCSTSRYAPESCCNYESYSRTSTSSVRGDYLVRSTYGTCRGLWGWTKTEYCLNSLSTACCTQGELHSISITCCSSSYQDITYSTCYGGVGFMNTEYCTNSRSISCCRNYDQGRASCCVSGPATCISSWYTRSYTEPDTCYGTSTYCCHSSRSCCNYNSYNNERSALSASGEPTNRVNEALIGGVIGGIVGPVLFIVVPIVVVCCLAKKRRAASTTNTTAFALTTTSDQSRPQPAFTAVTATSRSQARPQPDLAVTTNQSQPQPGPYHQPPPVYGSLYPPKSDDVDQPPPYSSLQLQPLAPTAPQMQQ